MTKNDICFSFNYGSERFLSSEHEFTQVCGDRVYSVEKGVTVTVKVKDLSAYDAIGWTLYFENKSGKNSGIFSDICDCDTALEIKHTEFPRIGYKPEKGNLNVISMKGMVEGFHYTENDPYSATEYGFSDNFLTRKRSFLNPTGRSSDSIMPFFNIKGLGGAMVAIGWTGSWKAEFERVSGKVSVKTGLFKTGFYLKDGEKLRTSSVLIMKYGENEDHSNKFRKLIKQHYSHIACTKADRDGIFACELWGGLESREMIKRLYEFKEHGVSFEDIWIDAGWYGNCTKCDDAFSGDWHRFTGDWRVNSRVHPDGLFDVRDAAAQCGSRLMLWFEPERPVPTVPAVKEHPEWFIPNPDNPEVSMNINYGIIGAREYVKATLSDYIEKLNLSVYRQDFNHVPAAYFESADEKDRIGITEIYHITGMYEVWDYLLERFPGLIIDNCASGGRRIDIESVSRSIPFFRSDYQCEFNANGDVLQAHNNISEYLPFNGCTSKVKCDDYDVRSSYSSSWGAAFYNAIFQSMDENDFEWAKKIHDEYRRIRKYFSKNYYNHASKVYDTSSWAIFQYHDEEEQSGIVLAFRREDSPFDSVKIRLFGVKDSERFEVENLNDASVFESGSTLEIVLPEKRSSVIFEYKKK